MIRGAFILAVGFTAGCAYTAAHNDEITQTVQDIKKAWAKVDQPENSAETPEGDLPQ